MEERKETGGEEEEEKQRRKRLGQGNVHHSHHLEPLDSQHGVSTLDRRTDRAAAVVLNLGEALGIYGFC